MKLKKEIQLVITEDSLQQKILELELFQLDMQMASAEVLEMGEQVLSLME